MLNYKSSRLPGSIAFYGASSVYGTNDPEGGFVGRFRKWYDNHRENGVVYNMGIPAETTDRLLERFLSEHERRNAHLIFFKVGANDSHRELDKDAPNFVSIETFKSNCRKLIDLALKDAHVAFITPYPIDESINPYNNKAYYLNDDIKAYTKALIEVASEQNLVVLNIFDEWLRSNLYKRYLSKDGLHANSKGYQYIADRVVDAVIRYFNHF